MIVTHSNPAKTFVIALAISSWLAASQQAICDERHTATVALLMPASESLDNCLDDPIGIAFNVHTPPAYATVQLGHDFGEQLDGQWLILSGSIYLSRGGAARNTVWAIADAVPPQNSFMLLTPNSVASVDYCVFVRYWEGMLVPTLPQYAEYQLVIVTGEVR